MLSRVSSRFFTGNVRLTQWFLLEDKKDCVDQFHIFRKVIQLDIVSGGVHSRKV